MYATKEVVISASAVNSPHLLMLSGIGPKDELEKHKVCAKCKAILTFMVTSLICSINDAILAYNMYYNYTISCTYHGLTEKDQRGVIQCRLSIPLL